MTLKDKLFGRKSEKSGSSDRSNELFDPEEAAVAGNKRGARPGYVGHRRRDYSHLVDDSRIPLNNNASERAGRGPAVARKNFYGSGFLWSGRPAAAMFSLLATLAHWKLNPRLWLTWYLESCAAAGGKTPKDIRPFLPWNLSAERRAAMAMRPPTPPATDTS
ncbi:MAG: transposase [Planctomycetia bacterium]|nr:transposase [Planctomycetia bacterium]